MERESHSPYLPSIARKRSPKSLLPRESTIVIAKAIAIKAVGLLLLLPSLFFFFVPSMPSRGILQQGGWRLRTLPMQSSLL